MDDNKDKIVARKKEQPVKIRKMIFANDFKDIWAGVVTGFIEPKIKDLVYGSIDAVLNTVKASAQMMIFNEARFDRNDGRFIDSCSYRDVNYHQISNSGGSSQTKQTSFRYDELIFKDYRTAEELKDRLLAIMRRYKRVRVADVYDELREMKIGAQAKGNYTDVNYGWTNLDDLKVVNDSDGWSLYYPPVKALN